MSTRVLPWISVAVLSALIFMSCGKTASEPGAGSDIVEVSAVIEPDGWEIPVDVANSTSPSRSDWLSLGWDTFIALSWPAEPDGAPGQPNEAASITDPNSAEGPLVWSTYLAKEQLLLPAGADPGTWNAPVNVAATNQGLPVLDGFTKTNPDFGGELDEAFSDAPLIDTNGNYVLYEIRVNQAEFTYFVANEYYNGAKQKASFQTDPVSFVGFPSGKDPIIEPGTNQPIPDYAQQGALEVKASWKILTDSDDASRYYTQETYYGTPDGQLAGPVTLGLVGLHILRLTPTTGSTWFWATFEQVDNLGDDGSFHSTDLPAPNADGFSYTPTKVVAGQPLPAPTPVNVDRVYPVPADVEATNAAYQAALAGSVWQYYQLIDVQNPGPTARPCQAPASNFPINTTACVNTDRLANVTMETYEQVTNGGPQSCVNCHGQFAFPQGVTEKTSEYQVFSFLLGNATEPPS